MDRFVPPFMAFREGEDKFLHEIPGFLVFHDQDAAAKACRDHAVSTGLRVVLKNTHGAEVYDSDKDPLVAHKAVEPAELPWEGAT